MPGKRTATRDAGRHARRLKPEQSGRRNRPTPARHERRDVLERLLPLLPPLAALIAYYDSFTAAFVFDDRTIAETRALRQLWSLDVVTGTTRPLVQLSLALNYAFGGLDVVGYH